MILVEGGATLKSIYRLIFAKFLCFHFLMNCCYSFCSWLLYLLPTTHNTFLLSKRLIFHQQISRQLQHHKYWYVPILWILPILDHLKNIFINVKTYQNSSFIKNWQIKQLTISSKNLIHEIPQNISILHQLYYKSVNRALSYIIIIHTNQIIITQSILVKFYFLSQLSTIDLTSIRPPSTFSQLKKISTNITNTLLNLFLSIYPLIILINKNFTEQVIHKKSSSNFFIKSLIPFQKSYKSVSISLSYIIIYLHHQEISIRTIPTKFHILPSELTNDHSPSQHLMKLSQHRNLLANIINSLFHLLLLLSPCRTSINTKPPKWKPFSKIPKIKTLITLLSSYHPSKTVWCLFVLLVMHS
jgi:hypothetical protein